jgi:hypothetical protein
MATAAAGLHVLLLLLLRGDALSWLLTCCRVNCRICACLVEEGQLYALPCPASKTAGILLQLRLLLHAADSPRAAVISSWEQ